MTEKEFDALLHRLSLHFDLLAIDMEGHTFTMGDGDVPLYDLEYDPDLVDAGAPAFSEFTKITDLQTGEVYERPKS